MPGYRVHDFLTVAAATASLPGYWIVADRPSWGGALLLAGSCLASGLLFSPDLDVRSRPRRRWGPAAALWGPYRLCIPHRSWVSHGAFVGPILRLAYFLAMLFLVAAAALWGINRWLLPVNRKAVLHSWQHDLLHAVHSHPRETALILVGFVLGGLVHTVADVAWSHARPRRRR